MSSNVLGTICSYLPDVHWGVMVGTSLLLYLAALVTYRLYFSPLARFPGPKLAVATGWFETYHDVFRGGKFVWELQRLHREYGPIIRINPSEIHINDVDFYKTLYTGPARKRDKYPFIINAGNPGSTFATPEYDHHRVRRAILAPYLTKRAVRNYENVIQEKLNDFCQHHMDRALATDGVLELHTCMIALLLDILSHLTFGESRCFNLLQASRFDGMWKAGINAFFELVILVRHFPLLYTCYLYLPLWVCALAVTPKVKSVAAIERAIANKVKQVSQACEGNKDSTSSDDGFIGDILRQQSVPPAEKAIPRLGPDAEFLIVAGTDAPSQVLAITLFHLLSNPGPLRKLQQELQQCLPDATQDPDLKTLEALPYLSAVIKEGIRISSVVTSRLPRVAPEDLQYKDWRVPAGTPISMSTYLIHNDADIFPEPKRFIPERWMAGPNLDHIPFPFSKGSQACLGPDMTFVWCYMVFGTLIRRYRMELFETSYENVETVRDCFNAQTRPGYNNIRIKVVGRCA